MGETGQATWSKYHLLPKQGHLYTKAPEVKMESSRQSHLIGRNGRPTVRGGTAPSGVLKTTLGSNSTTTVNFFISSQFLGPDQLKPAVPHSSSSEVKGLSWCL